jgi:hypothetical protein
MFKVGLVSRPDLWGWLVAGGTGRRELLVSKGWIQAVALTFVVGFFLLGLIGYKTYSGSRRSRRRSWIRRGTSCSPGRTSRTARRCS